MLALADVDDPSRAEAAKYATPYIASAYIATSDAVRAAVFALSVPASTAAGLAPPAAGVAVFGAIGAAPFELQSVDGAATPFLDLAVLHTKGVSMDASDASLDDRLKMFYHENMACSARSALEFAPCKRSGARAFVGDGFDLAIDDCAYPASERAGYGQCERLDERDDALHNWWKAHTASYAARQVAAYEVDASLGWSFGAWKLSDAREANLTEYVSRAACCFLLGRPVETRRGTVTPAPAAAGAVTSAHAAAEPRHALL